MWPYRVDVDHDRAFLDEAATTIIGIDPSRDGARRHGGGYSDCLAEKVAEPARWEARFADEQDELKAPRYAVEVTSRSVAPNRAVRDNDKMGYDFTTGRIDNRVSRRVRNARERLDEPTVDQVRKPPTELEEALGSYPGAVVIVSHDRWLRRRWTGEHLRMSAGVLSR